MSDFDENQEILYEGGPWVCGDTSFVEFIEHMWLCIAKGLNVPFYQLTGAKQCLSCGAYQTITGALPCDH